VIGNGCLWGRKQVFNMSNNQSLLNTVSKKSLTMGKHIVKVVDFREVINPNGGYIEVSLQFSDRTMKTNWFPNQLNYLLGCLKAQLGKSNCEMTAFDILNSVKDKEIFVICSMDEEYGLNISLSESKA
jgi:hypothetical protein